MMAWFLKRLWRKIVPVVAFDIRRVIAAAASRLPTTTAEKVLMSQLDYAVGRPKILARGFEYRLNPSAPRLAGLEGELELAVVEMCYYQQVIPFCDPSQGRISALRRDKATATTGPRVR